MAYYYYFWRLNTQLVKKIVSVGLSALLLCHALAYVLVGISAWYKAEHDLSERLRVYRSVDSLVEFDIPLNNQIDIKQTASDGFTHRGHYYSVVSLNVAGDTLHITGLETDRKPFWQSDLLSFLNDHLTNSTDTERKAHSFLKFLLKEYSPTPRQLFQFLPAMRVPTVRIADVSFVFPLRALPVHSPPPEA